MSYENQLIREATGDADAATPPWHDPQRVGDYDIEHPPDEPRCSECGGPMISVYHRRGGLLPLCALCAEQCGKCWRIDCTDTHDAETTHNQNYYGT